ncbi:hypothetical protein HXY32_03680 [Candidatus Bathyarchaeota archaeon]|nr:hypothetical protein [Candidatus Bathyarchaeota archaeon]
MSLQQEENESISYVQATCRDDEPSNATAYAYTPNGTRYAVCTTIQFGYKFCYQSLLSCCKSTYAVCTTIQFGYKPSANSTILTVEPQATQTETPLY